MAPYQLPTDYYFKLGIALILKRKRSLQRDARHALQNPAPPLELRGAEHIPAGGRYLVTVNHYTAQGHNVLWSAIAISAVIPSEVHWVMTNAWTFPGKPFHNLLRHASELFFARLAAIYDISLTPPMPPDPREQVARALSIRHLLAFARQAPEAVIGFAPEGRDFPGNILGWPPYGAGRLMLDRVVFVLDRPKELANVGAVVRLMGNFGLSRLRLVEPAAFDEDRVLRYASRGEFVAARVERVRGETKSSASGRAFSGGSSPSALGMARPWGQVWGLPRCAARRSSTSSERTCSNLQASSWTWSQGKSR